MLADTTFEGAGMSFVLTLIAPPQIYALPLPVALPIVYEVFGESPDTVNDVSVHELEKVLPFTSTR